MPGFKERVFALKTSLYTLCFQYCKPLLKKKFCDVIIVDFAKSGVYWKYHITKTKNSFCDVIMTLFAKKANLSDYHITKLTIPEKFAE